MERGRPSRPGNGLCVLNLYLPSDSGSYLKSHPPQITLEQSQGKAAQTAVSTPFRTASRLTGGQAVLRLVNLEQSDVREIRPFATGARVVSVVLGTWPVAQIGDDNALFACQA